MTILISATITLDHYTKSGNNPLVHFYNLFMQYIADAPANMAQSMAHKNFNSAHKHFNTKHRTSGQVNFSPTLSSP